MSKARELIGATLAILCVTWQGEGRQIRTEATALVLDEIGLAAVDADDQPTYIARVGVGAAGETAWVPAPGPVPAACYEPSHKIQITAGPCPLGHRAADGWTRTEADGALTSARGEQADQPAPALSHGAGAGLLDQEDEP